MASDECHGDGGESGSGLGIFGGGRGMQSRTSDKTIPFANNAKDARQEGVAEELLESVRRLFSNGCRDAIRRRSCFKRCCNRNAEPFHGVLI